MTITIRKRNVLLLVLLLALVMAGIAITSWSTSTSGNGYSKATTASALVLSDASASTRGDLYPGGAGDLKLKVANPNSFPVRITAVSLTSGGTITSNIAACNTGGTGVTLDEPIRVDARPSRERRRHRAHRPGRGAHELELRHELPGRNLHDPGRRHRRQ